MDQAPEAKIMAKETFVRFVSVENVGGEFQVFFFSLLFPSPFFFFFPFSFSFFQRLFLSYLTLSLFSFFLLKTFSSSHHRSQTKLHI